MAKNLYKRDSVMEEHYITQGYVHYNPKHVDWNYTTKVFNNNNQIDRNVQMLNMRYKAKLSKVLKIKNSNGESLSLLDMDDQTVQVIFEEMAKQINTNIDKNMADKITSFGEYEAAARQVSNVFATTNFSDNDFNKMMSSIAEALKLVNAYNGQIWNDFVLQYGILMRGREQMGSKKIQKSINVLNGLIKTSENNSVLSSVLRVLSNIPKGMITGNLNYTAQQMTGTLNSIFDTSIGEALAAILHDMGIAVDNEIVSTFQQAKTTGKGRVKSSINPRKKVQGKIDISKNGAVDISLALQQTGNLDYTISGEINSSVKWYQSKNLLPSHISIQGASSYVKLAQSIFNDDYSIYNNLAFYNSGIPTQESGFRIMRSAVIAKYLDQFIAGSGQTTSDGQIDTASFLVINGKFYPIFSILAVYLNEVKNKKDLYGSQQQGDLVYIHLFDVDNSWQGDKKLKNYTSAIKRSQKAKAVINKFKANIALNTKSLQELCKRISPIN